MMAFATRAVLGQRRFEASEATSPWTVALDGNGNTFWYNELTNETTYSPPSDGGRGCGCSSQLPTAGATSMARPINDRMMPCDGFMSPSGGCMPHANGYMSPPVRGYTAPPSLDDCPNGCMSPRSMTLPAGGYESHPGSACMSPVGFRQCRQQEQQRNHHPVATRSPRFLGHTPGATPQRYGNFDDRQEGRRRGARTTSSSSAASTAFVSAGYRWEECYRQSDGKKFWRHRETGVILKKDPYR